VQPLIARRCTEHGSGVGCVRWVVERTFAWVHNVRRIRIRSERDAGLRYALLSLGCSLYPMLEGALRNDPDARRRIVNEFDLRSQAYTGRTWQYRVDAAFPDAVIGDLTALDQHRFVLIERDDAQGADARQKKVYLVDLRRVGTDGYLEKRPVVDLLSIRDREGISLPARPGEFGVGDPFSFPLQSVESLEVMGGERLLIASDNNYPFSDGRWTARDRPDDTELIVVRAPALR
jgi:hypothetical protein